MGGLMISLKEGERQREVGHEDWCIGVGAGLPVIGSFKK
jgi:hypothetical protein